MVAGCLVLIYVIRSQVFHLYTWIQSGGFWFMSVRTERSHSELTSSRSVPEITWCAAPLSSSSVLSQSVTGVFSSSDDQVEVSCCLDKNQFIIGGVDGGPRVPLKVRKYLISSIKRPV